MSKKPVIFLAFANDRVDNAAYLRNLPKEMQGIRKALERARQAGLCEIVERSNATIEQLLDIFQSSEYQNRIAIFHYGGHANGYQLLLESQDGSHAKAHKEGLVSFLAKQRGLKMVFLNGCSSQQQAFDLLEAGVPSVVGTSQSINDDVATDLAIRFYAGLGQGHALEKAWDEAVDEMRIKKGTANMRDLFWEGAGEEMIDRFPWDIQFRDGAEIVREWNLPEAVDNPLFGLPPIPPKHHLPETPYLYLMRYQREQAEVFFGRSYYIRAMYNMVTDPKSPPLMLLYGQSGVGKSSLVEAGFKPRLEETHHVWYLRRDQGVSIPDLFAQASDLRWRLLGGNAADAPKPATAKQSAELQQLDDFVGRLETMNDQYQAKLPPEMAELFARMKMEMKAAKDFYLLKQGKYSRAKRRNGPQEASALFTTIANEQIQMLPLLEQWLYIEEMTGKPLIIIVDQLESVFISPHQEHPNEFDDFCNDLTQIFSDPERLPRGKLILSYRKEYHPEIEERFKQHQIPRTGLFIKHLERKDIEEVVLGLTLTERVRQQYRLVVEPNLPVVIADDLLEDRESPIAPILQILLTKMWQMMEAGDSGTKYLTIAMYQKLRQEGLLMDDFYLQQMMKLKAWNAEVVNSGLALDLMTFHVTGMMTAAVRTREEVMEEYSENLDDIKLLLEKLTELFLLSGIQVGNESVKTTLAHDTLAPVIFKQYRQSDYPGQRARRVLENKADNFDERDLDTTLDLNDLAVVEAGHYGMRAWKPQEQRLVNLSIERRKRMLRGKKRLRRVGMIGFFFIVALGILAAFEAARARREKKEAENQRQEAEKQKELANENAVRAHEAEMDAQDEAARAKVAQKAAQIAAEQAHKAELAAQVAAQQAHAAEIRAQEEADIATDAKARAQSSLVLAQNKALEALKNARIARQKEEEAKRNAQIADSLSNLAQTKALALKAVQGMTSKEEAEIRGLLALKAFNDMERFGGSQQDKDIYDALRIAWDRLSETASEIDASQGEVELMFTSNDGKILITGGTDGRLKLWNVGEDGLAPGKQLVFCQDATCYVNSIDLSPSFGRVISTHSDGVVRLWKIESGIQNENSAIKRSTNLLGHSQPPIAAFFYNESQVVSIDGGGDMLYWDLEKSMIKHASKYQFGGRILAATKHPTEEALLVAVAQQGLMRVDLASGEVSKWIGQEAFNGVIDKMIFNQLGNRLAVGMKNGRVMMLKYKQQLETLDKHYVNEWQAHNSGITDLTFSVNGEYLGSCSYDKSLQIYQVSQIEKAFMEPKPIVDLQHTVWLKSMSFLGKGERIIFGGSSRYMNIYNTDINKLSKNIKQALKDRLSEIAKKEQVRASLESFVKGRTDYDDIMALPFK